MSDHEYIWLEPQCCADKGDRHWCEDNVYDQDNSFESLCDCLNPVHATKYIRIDLHDAEVKRLEAELRKLQPDTDADWWSDEIGHLADTQEQSDD